MNSLRKSFLVLFAFAFVCTNTVHAAADLRLSPSQVEALPEGAGPGSFYISFAEKGKKNFQVFVERHVSEEKTGPVEIIEVYDCRTGFCYDQSHRELIATFKQVSWEHYKKFSNQSVSNGLQFTGCQAGGIAVGGTAAVVGTLLLPVAGTVVAGGIGYLFGCFGGMTIGLLLGKGTQQIWPLDDSHKEALEALKFSIDASQRMQKNAVTINKEYSHELYNTFITALPQVQAAAAKRK